MNTVIRNANIYVERDNFAQAMLVRDGVIESVGTDADIAALAPEGCEVIDAQGRTIVPGFNDSHMHLHNVGASLRMVNLYAVDSIEEMIRRGRAFIEENRVPAGSVVLGRGWNQDYFTDEVRIPTRQDLDRISTEHPVIFTRACGHMLVCNTCALEQANVTRDTPQVPGAVFELEEDGYPNGIFTETAQALIQAVIPALTVDEMKVNIRAAMDYALSHGITSIQTNDVKDDNYADMLRAYTEMSSSDPRFIRTYHQCCMTTPETFERFLADGHVTGEGTDLNRVGPLKMFVDGSLGARTALMRADYHDEPGTRGITCMTQDELDRMVNIANDHKMQVAIHAIGDGAIEMVLDSYANVIQNHQNTLRHGIVHCQITDEAMINRFKENDILALVQPIFVHYDMHIVADRVGPELACTSYAFGTMGRMGIHVSYGTDSPVEDMNTMDNIYSAVNRQDLHGGADVYRPEERVDICTAIDNYTIGSAYCSFEETRKGRLQPGFFADMAVLDRNIFEIPSSEIRDVKVVSTIIGGRVVYER